MVVHGGLRRFVAASSSMKGSLCLLALLFGSRQALSLGEPELQGPEDTPAHETAMSSRAAAMAEKQVDAHRAMDGLLGLGQQLSYASPEPRIRKRKVHASTLDTFAGIIDASKYADPTGTSDAAPGLQRAIDDLVCITPPERQFSLWSNATDLGGRTLELSGGIYVVHSPLSIPSGVANFKIQGGTLRAAPSFPANESLLSLGDDGGGHIESVSLTSMLLHGGGGLAQGSLLKVTYGVGISIGPAVYFEGFAGIGAHINKGAEALIHECWFVGQYGHGLPFYGGRTKHPPDVTLFNSTAVQIDGNDHYVSDVVIWQYTQVGVRVNGEGNLLSGVHAWGCGAAWCDSDWYQDLGLSSKSLTGIEIHAPRNRVLRCCAFVCHTLTLASRNLIFLPPYLHNYALLA